MTRKFSEVRVVLARQVKARRKHLNLSQEQLALEADVDRTYVSQIERGIGNPSLLVLHKLAVVLRIELSELLT